MADGIKVEYMRHIFSEHEYRYVLWFIKKFGFNRWVLAEHG